MQEFTIDVQQQIAASETPGAELQALPWTRQRAVFFQLPESIQRDVLDDMDRQEVRRFVRRLGPDDAADAIGLLDGDTQEAVLGQLDTDRRERIEFLLNFGPDSAAGMMELGYVTVDNDQGTEEMARLVRRHETRTGRFPTVLVTDGDEVLGELPGHTLALAGHGSAVITECLRHTPTVRYEQSDSEVIEVFGANRRVKSLFSTKTTVFSESSTRTTSCRPSRKRWESTHEILLRRYRAGTLEVETTAGSAGL